MINHPTEFIKRGVDYILPHVNWDDRKESNTGYQSIATNTGNQSIALRDGKPVEVNARR